MPRSCSRSRSASPASSTGSSSPSPAQRKKACLGKPNRKWSPKKYHVKRGKKSPITGKPRKAYDVKGHCVKTKTAWMTMLQELWKSQQGHISYSECMDWAKDMYKIYGKTHTEPSGRVKLVHADVKALVKKEVSRK